MGAFDYFVTGGDRISRGLGYDDREDVQIAQPDTPADPGFPIDSLGH
jgi:hypothetical protein